MYCQKCGKQLMGHENFCGSCGTPLVKDGNTVRNLLRILQNFFRKILKYIKWPRLKILYILILVLLFLFFLVGIINVIIPLNKECRDIIRFYPGDHGYRAGSSIDFETKKEALDYCKHNRRANYRNNKYYFITKLLPSWKDLWGSHKISNKIDNGVGEKIENGSNDSFVCGDDVLYNGKSYPTIWIGTQCWLKKNLDVGVLINGASESSNNSIIEKYCYDNKEMNCSLFGGLYQWDEAMQYSTTEGAQGICPKGWHIPTDAEQNTLDQYLSDTTCDANRSGKWDCANAGAKLKFGGSSGFYVILAGVRLPNGHFDTLNSLATFWSSSINGTAAWYRYLYIGLPSINRFSYSNNSGFSIRCLKN